MPFITEEIWQHLPHEGETITLAEWPKSDGSFRDEKAEQQMEAIMEAIRAIRNIRAEMDVAPSRKANVIIVSERRSGTCLPITVYTLKGWPLPPGLP